jgi:hypothetical protein
VVAAFLAGAAFLAVVAVFFAAAAVRPVPAVVIRVDVRAIGAALPGGLW